MKKHWSALLLLTLLAACASAGERAEMRAQKEIDACTARGLPPDTPAFEDCRLDVRAQREREKEARVNSFDSLRMIQSNHTGQISPF